MSYNDDIGTQLAAGFAGASQYAAQNEHDSDDTVSDPNLPEPETQSESLKSIVEDTQFGPLEPETQTDEEISPVPRAEIVVAAIERPKSPSNDDMASIFKYGKAPMRPHTSQNKLFVTKPTNKDPNLCAKATVPDMVQLKSISGRPFPEASQVAIPSLPAIAQAHSSWGRNRPLANERTICNSPNQVHQNPPSKKPMNQDKSPPPQVNTKTAFKESPTPGASPLPGKTAIDTQYPLQVPVVSTEGSILPAKSGKPSLQRVPFPEVIPTPKQHRNTANRNSLGSLDVNKTFLGTQLTDQSLKSHASNSSPGQAKINQLLSAKIATGVLRRGVAISSAQAGEVSLPNESPSENWPQVPRPDTFRLASLDQINGQASLEDAQASYIPVHPTKNQMDEEDSQQVSPLSQFYSRPQSAFSNTSKMRSRPYAREDLQPQGVFESTALHAQHLMRVQKSIRPPPRTDHRSITPNWSQFNTEKQTPTTGTFALHNIRNFIQNLPLIEEILQKYEAQNAVLESQQTHIESLKVSTIESEAEIERLKVDREALSAKLKRFADISSKYKKHMNEVVQSQKFLMEESKKMRLQSTVIRNEAKAATKAEEVGIKKAREIQRLIDGGKVKLESEVQYIKDLEIENTKYTSENQQCKSDLQKLQQENAKCKSDVENYEKSNELLQSELNARLLDLGRERHSAEQLQKSLTVQGEAHRELVEAIDKAQTTIVEELTKEGGLLTSIVTSEGSLLTKINELSAHLDTINSRKPELSPALTKLIEGLYTRIETRLQPAANKDGILYESCLKLFEDVKECIEQLRLDEVAKTSLHERISELRESNSALSTSVSARETEHQSMAKRIGEVEQDLSKSRDQLTTKSDELAVLRALPKEDPILLAKIHDLEANKTILEIQVNALNRDVTKAKEELVLCQETMRNAQEESQTWQNKHREAQTKIQDLQGDRKKYVAAHKASTDKACQEARKEIAKATDALSKETKIHHEGLIKSLEQCRTKAQQDLALAQEELQKYQEESVSHAFNFKKLQEELVMCKKVMAEQSASIDHADRFASRKSDLDYREGNLKQTVTAMKSHLNLFEIRILQKIGDAFNHQIKVEGLIEQVEGLEKEKVGLEKRKTFNASEAKLNRGHGKSGEPEDHSMDEQSVKQIVGNQTGVPAAPTSRTFPAQRHSPTNTNTSSSHTRMSDRNELGHVPDTPKDTLLRKLVEPKSTKNKTPVGQNLPIADRAARAQEDDCRITLTGSQRIYAYGTSMAVELNSSGGVSSSPNQGTPKPLRPANRKSSGLAHFQGLNAIEEARSTKVASSNIPQNNTDEWALAAGATMDASPSSAGGSRRIESGRGLTSSVQPRGAANEPAIIPKRTVETTLPESGRNMSSSPLSDFDTPGSSSIVDQIVVCGKIQEEFHVEQSVKTGAAKRGACVIQKPTADSFAGVRFKNTPTQHNFEDENTAVASGSGVRSTPRRGSMHKEPTMRRPSAQLKSALKKSDRPSNMASTRTQYTLKPSKYTPPGHHSAKATSLSNTKKQQASARPGSIVSVYNGVVMGSKPDGRPSQASASRPTPIFSGDKSPLMHAPERKKRTAEGTEESTKPPKLRRLTRRKTMPNEDSGGRSVIPDSQDSTGRH